LITQISASNYMNVPPSVTQSTFKQKKFILCLQECHGMP